jgi:hypothetical protein
MKVTADLTATVLGIDDCRIKTVIKNFSCPISAEIEIDSVAEAEQADRFAQSPLRIFD